MRILDLPTASFVEKKWKQERNQYGRVCRGDLLRGIQTKTWQEQRRSWRARKCRRHSKIEERRTHNIDRMVERKKHRKETRSWKGSTWTRTNRDFFFTSVGRMHREVRHGYTNSDGLKNRRSTMVERSTKKTQFEVERSTPEAILMLKMGSADRGVQRIQRRDVRRCFEKRVMAGRSTGQETKRKEQSFPPGQGKSTLKHRAQITRKSESVSKPSSIKVFQERSAQIQS